MAFGIGQLTIEDVEYIKGDLRDSGLESWAVQEIDDHPLLPVHPMPGHTWVTFRREYMCGLEPVIFCGTMDLYGLAKVTMRKWDAAHEHRNGEGVVIICGHCGHENGAFPDGGPPNYCRGCGVPMRQRGL